MAILRRLLVLLLAITLFGSAAAAAQIPVPWLSVTPESGVRPLTVVVRGSDCLGADPADGPATYWIRLQWQVEGAPSTAQTVLLPAVDAGSQWSTSIVLGVPNLGRNTISATCQDSGGTVLRKYPDQQVEVDPVPPTLVVSPTTIAVGESLGATANGCPDPELPRIGGSYSVRFTLEYLVPPSGIQGPYSESIVVQTSPEGVGTATFLLPADAPTQGGAYRLNATCQIEELGFTSGLFDYPPVAVVVQPAPTPTPTAIPTPTTTPIPSATATPNPTTTPQPTPVPTSTPLPQPTFTPPPSATPTLTPTPPPTPTPRPGVIIFTG